MTRRINDHEQSPAYAADQLVAIFLLAVSLVLPNDSVWIGGGRHRKDQIKTSLQSASTAFRLILLKIHVSGIVHRTAEGKHHSQAPRN